MNQTQLKTRFVSRHRPRLELLWFVSKKNFLGCFQFVPFILPEFFGWNMSLRVLQMGIWGQIDELLLVPHLSLLCLLSVCVTYFILHSWKMYNISIASQALSSQAIMSSVFPAELDMQHFHQRTNNCLSVSIVFSFPPDAPNRRAAYFSMATCNASYGINTRAARAAHAWVPACLLVLTSSSFLEMKWYTRELSHDGDAGHLCSNKP